MHYQCELVYYNACLYMVLDSSNLHCHLSVVMKPPLN